MEEVQHIHGNPSSLGDHCTFGILTISDRASTQEYEDKGGPAIFEFFEQSLLSSATVHYRCIPDEQHKIENSLVELADVLKCDVIVTTGGTGPSKRDVTPEATEAVCDKILDGFGEQMRAISLQYVPTAILSRQLGGLRGSTLIFNLPGQPKAIRETIDEVWRAVPYCIDLIGGPYMEMNPNVVKAFRPKAAQRQS